MLSRADLEAIKAEAREELDQEAHRAAVDRMKERLLDHDRRSLWARLFPWTIHIERRYPTNV